jgi:hypothetical protein
MRVLVVLAHKNSPRGKQLGERFVKHVRAAFAACPIFQERLDVLVRSYNQLEDFLPPAAGETDVPDIVKVRDRLTCLDGIEFVFIDGDDNLLPWTQPAAPLLKLLHLCMISGKIVFGCSCAVQLLAYLVNVGPVQVPVLNGKGRGGALGGFNGGGGRPASASTGAGSSSSAGGGGGVLLERETGDLFRFDARRGAWAPVGNVGVHCSVGAGLGVLAGLLGNLLWQRLGAVYVQAQDWRLRAVAVLLAITVYVLLDEPLDFAQNTPLQQVLAVVVTGVLLVFAWRQRGGSSAKAGGL